MKIDQFFSAVWSTVILIAYIYAYMSGFAAAFAHEWGEAGFWMLFIVAINTMKAREA